MTLIDGIRVGHWTDQEAATGLTVFLLPPSSVAAAAPRGQNPGTLNVPVFQPGGSADHADAIVLTGGSCYGLPAAAHVAHVLAEQDVETFASGDHVPFVIAAVIYDLKLGRRAWPTPQSVESAVRTAAPAGDEEVGTVGVGTGATAGSIDGTAGAMKGGFGRASRATAQGATIVAWAAVNPVGDVLEEDGRVIAGLRRDGNPTRVVDVLATDEKPRLDWGRATTLVVVATDARLDKRATARLAEAGHSGIAQAVSPCATGLDGDTAFAVATSKVEITSVLALEAVAAAVAAEAVRSAVRSAVGLHGVPAARDLAETA
ncbi:MAG: P1 family peptidase [Actinomycetota bacterium]|nr:P1 family peptidase [Actinomycetota bacterium]